MHLGHTRQSTFSSIDFVKNKTEKTKRKIYKPVPPNVRPCRMLGAASFSYRLRPSQYFSFFVWHGGKTETIPRFGGAKST